MAGVPCYCLEMITSLQHPSESEYLSHTCHPDPTVKEMQLWIILESRMFATVAPSPPKST
jgi:hypothetical protein